jgi:zinc protease
MKTIIAVIVAVSAGLAASAQTMDRSKPPASREPRPYKLPPVTETRLANGLTVLMAEDPRVPLVTARLVFLAGNKRDPNDLPGLAASVSAMLLQGTTTRSFQQIAEQLDDLGAVLDATSGDDQIMIAGSILNENTGKLLEIMADVARRATFPENELTLYRQNRKQTLSVQRAQSAFLANEEFRKAIFGEHPYAHIGPTMASLDRIDRKTLVEYRDTSSCPTTLS